MTDAVSAEAFTALQREVRRLSDREAILAAMVRYTRGADRLDRELLLSAYHPDATDDRGAFTGDRQARADWLLAYLETVGHTSHHVSNFSIEIDGDVAHAESYVLSTLVPKEGGTVSIGGARYLDRLERRGDEWRIAHRESVMDFTFTVPTKDLPPSVLPGLRSAADRSYARPLELSAGGRARLRKGVG